jgi:hypothetical protein
MMPNPSVELFRLINGYQMTQAIHVVASLGLADQLRDGARSAEELARLAKAHPTALYRLLRATAAAGIFHEITTGGFRSHGWAIAFVPTHRPPWGRGLSSSDVPTCGRPGVIFCKASKPVRTPSTAYTAHPLAVPRRAPGGECNFRSSHDRAGRKCRGDIGQGLQFCPVSARR